MVDWAPNNDPPKGAIANLESAETFEFEFNPPEFTESISANYARHNVLGLSHQILQYLNTNNNKITLDIYLSGVAPFLDASRGLDRPETMEAAYDISRGKNFLQSLVYPTKSPYGGWRAPPELLFVWPKVVRMLCVATNVSFTHQKFSSKDLRTLSMTATITLEELVKSQRFSGTVRLNGSMQYNNNSVSKSTISAPL